jgi:hypothetical protein
MTIELQVSDALEFWTTIATSTAGGNVIPGNGGIVFSDIEISGQSPARLVTIQLSIPSGTGARFVRVKTTRAF